MSPIVPKRLSRALVMAVLAPLLAFAALVAWSLSSTVGSSPDDDFHLASIWCGLGERPGLCEVPQAATLERFPNSRLVPAPIRDAACFAFLPDDSGDCWDADEAGMSRADRANADGLYPPLFYAAMAPFASQDVTGSVVTMRVVNSAFAVVVVTSVFFLLPRRLRPALLISVLASSVPLGLFLYASTNPSSWALLSAAVLWISLYGAMVTDSRGRRITLTVIALLGAVIGAGSRADAAIFAVFGAAIALLLGWRRATTNIVPTAGAAGIILVAAAFYLTSGQSGAAVTGIATSAAPLTLSEHATNFLNVPLLWAGAVGNWGLGWLDTPLPGAVWVLAMFVVGGVLLVGMGGIRWRRTVALLLSLAALWIVPFALLATSNAVVGAQVQPRYILPLLIIVLGVAAASPLASDLWTPSRVGLMAAALAVAAAISLHSNMRRYTTGLDVSSLDPGRNAEWWWPVAPTPFAVWVGGAIAFAGLLAILWLASAKPQGVALTADAADARSGADRRTVSETS